MYFSYMNCFISLVFGTETEKKLMTARTNHVLNMFKQVIHQNKDKKTASNVMFFT